MKLKEIAELVEARIIVGEQHLDIDITNAFAADLMSDVLAFAKAGSLLLTGLVNPQVIRTVEVVDISAVLFVRGKMPLKETVELAAQKEIALLSTKYILFETCGRLYKAGIKGSIERVD